MSSRLFVYFLKLHLDNTNLNHNGVPQGYISMRFPDDEVSKDDKPIIDHQLHLFCFPDPLLFPTKQIKPKDAFFEFVLTNVSSKRRYGYCFRSLVGTGSKRWPICYCFFTAHASGDMFRDILKVAEREGNLDDANLVGLMEILYEQSLPKPGGSIDFQWRGEDMIARSAGTKECLFGYDNYEILLAKMDSFVILSIFISLLLERRMIFISSSLSVLTSCIQGAVAMLNPFAWQHVFIPILPPAMLDFACAPMPFILGILTMYCDTLMTLPLEEVIFVDLDNGIMIPPPPDYQLIPPFFLEQLVHDISSVKYSLSKHKGQKAIREGKRDGGIMLGNIERGILRFFKDTLMTYHDFFGMDKEFDKEAFANSGENSPIREYLKLFVMSQMFEVYIEDRKHSGLNTILDTCIVNKIEFPRSREGIVTLMDGKLSKVGKKTSIITERFFVLDTECFSYKKTKHGDIISSLNLSDVIEVNLVNDTSFSVQTENEEWILQHNNEDVIQTWVQLIQYRVNIARASLTLLLADEVDQYVKTAQRSIKTYQGKIHNPLKKIKSEDILSMFGNAGISDVSNFIRGSKKKKQKKMPTEVVGDLMADMDDDDTTSTTFEEISDIDFGDDTMIGITHRNSINRQNFRPKTMSISGGTARGIKPLPPPPTQNPDSQSNEFRSTIKVSALSQMFSHNDEFVQSDGLPAKKLLTNPLSQSTPEKRRLPPAPKTAETNSGVSSIREKFEQGLL